MLGMKLRRSLRICPIATGLCVAIFAVATVCAWLQPTLALSDVVESDEPFPSVKDCKNKQTITIEMKYGTKNLSDMCVQYGNELSVAMADGEYVGTYVKAKQWNYYKLVDPSVMLWAWIVGDKLVYYKPISSEWGYSLTVADNATSVIFNTQDTIDHNTHVAIRINEKHTRDVIDKEKFYHMWDIVPIIDEGRFIVAMDNKIASINVNTDEVRILYNVSHSDPIEKRLDSLASGGKNYVLVRYSGKVVVLKTTSCGAMYDEAFQYDEENKGVFAACMIKDLSNQLRSEERLESFILDEDGDTLHIETSNYKDGEYIKKHLITTLSGEPINTFEYLAIGDSFSSGEGDVDYTKFASKGIYRKYTDDSGFKLIDGSNKRVGPEDKCHISENSYPYLLAYSMKIRQQTNKAWQTVACSGATIEDVSGARSNSYLGQKDSSGKPRLSWFENAKEQKEEALREFIPGRQKQIEFIKMYKPKAVTLTIGGNDIQFGDIVRACVRPIGSGGEWSKICSYAKNDEKKSNLAFAIIDMRPKFVKLYKELLAAGPKGMKLYVIGYPLFAALGDIRNSTCDWSTRLVREEREMAIEATKFLNQIMRSAAEEAGAIYVNTETSLNKYSLCGVSKVKAVNGVRLQDSNESFHPNSLGHVLIYDRIWGAVGRKTLSSYKCQDSEYITCPGGDKHKIVISKYFEKAINENIRAKLNRDIVADIVKAPGKIAITVLDYTIGSNNPIDILLFSEQVHLGTYKANERGGFNQEIQLPEGTKFGYHTIELVTKDPEGNPMRIWKIIEIRSNDPNDYDGDGIPNDIDMCQYIESSGIDSDKDGVDDNCDDYVEGRDTQPMEVALRIAQDERHRIMDGAGVGAGSNEAVQNSATSVGKPVVVYVPGEAKKIKDKESERQDIKEQPVGSINKDKLEKDYDRSKKTSSVVVIAAAVAAIVIVVIGTAAIIIKRRKA